MLELMKEGKVSIFSAFQCIAYICRAVSRIFFFHSTVAILRKTVTQTWPYVLRKGWSRYTFFHVLSGQGQNILVVKRSTAEIHHIRINLRSSPVFKRQK